MNTLRHPIRRSSRRRVVVIAILLTLTVGGALPARAQAPPVGTDIVAALKATPGVLGVDAARTQSGKQVIFAWFENKQALLGWFYSDAHQGLMQRFTPGASTGRTPLAGVPENSGPILAIASLTFAAQPSTPAAPPPIAQIAIELYTPMPGGVAVGGRFAPNTVKVPGLLEVNRPIK